MGTLRYHGGGGLDCRGIDGLSTVFFAGSNIQISKGQYDICKKHPYLKDLLDRSILEYVRGEDKVELIELGIPTKEHKPTGEKYPVVDAALRSVLGDSLPLTLDTSGGVATQQATRKKEKAINVPIEEIKGSNKVSDNPYDL